MKNYLLYHTWTEFLSIFPSNFIFFHQSETIAADDKNIWSWNHRSSFLFSYFPIFFSFPTFYPILFHFTSINRWLPIQFNRKNHLFNHLFSLNSPILQSIYSHFNLNVNRHRYTSLQFSPLPRSINFPLPGYHLLHALQICPTRRHVSKTDRIVAVSRPKDITVGDEIRLREIFNTKRSITSEKLATIVIIHERDSYDSKIFWRSS